MAPQSTNYVGPEIPVEQLSSEIHIYSREIKSFSLLGTSNREECKYLNHVVSSVPLDFEASKGAIPTNSILQTSRCRQRLCAACFPVFQELQSS